MIVVLLKGGTVRGVLGWTARENGLFYVYVLSAKLIVSCFLHLHA